MLDKRVPLIAICALLFAETGESFDRFVNYAQVIRVNDFLIDSDTLWVATSGGLYGHHRAQSTGILYSDPSLFPDPNITALYRDPNGTLWMGSENGYLYKRPRNGRQSVINAYCIADWEITDITGYGKYLIIGADKGCGVFDTEKLLAVKNATSFGDAFTDSKVNALMVARDPSGQRDSLLLGLGRTGGSGGRGGIAKLPMSGLMDSNFYDPSIWTADTSDTLPVVSFAQRAGGYRAFRRFPGTFFLNGAVTSAIQGDFTNVSYDAGGSAVTLPGKITTISADGGQCFIGTEADCFYMWDGVNAWNIRIPGATFKSVSRVLVDREGIVWICPVVSGVANKWSEGISAFKGGNLQFYHQAKYPQMGWLGGGEIKGVAEDRLGGMWFGTSGGNVKRFNRGNTSWLNYFIFAQSDGADKFFSGTTLPDPAMKPWAMSQAIASDSTGFLWIGVYNNKFGDLLCYDPRNEPNPDAQDPKTAGYRRLWASSEVPFSDNNWPTCLCVDASNTIIVGYNSCGKIIAFSHNGNPLEHGITQKYSFDGKGIVYGATATPDTLTRIVTSTGLYTFDSRLGTLKLLDSSLTEVTAVEAEDAQILWIGTLNSGLLRYDLLNKRKTVVDETAGLLSNHVKDLSIDRKGGYLWIATERGVSRYTLGYSVGSKNLGIHEIYPNPFSKRRHREMVFQKLPPASKLLIYTAGGSLVAALSPQSASAYGAACVWKPSAQIVPGLYFYAVQSGTKGVRGKFIITP